LAGRLVARSLFSEKPIFAASSGFLPLSAAWVRVRSFCDDARSPCFHYRRISNLKSGPLRAGR